MASSQFPSVSQKEQSKSNKQHYNFSRVCQIGLYVSQLRDEVAEAAKFKFQVKQEVLSLPCLPALRRGMVDKKRALKTPSLEFNRRMETGHSRTETPAHTWKAGTDLAEMAGDICVREGS